MRKISAAVLCAAAAFLTMSGCKKAPPGTLTGISISYSGMCYDDTYGFSIRNDPADGCLFSCNYKDDEWVELENFTNLVAPYADITELDEELVHTLIEKIIVHEKEIIDGETVMRIEIYYRFIGKTSDCLNRSVTPIKTKTESVAATDSIA